jgi:hypothetical protein
MNWLSMSESKHLSLFKRHIMTQNVILCLVSKHYFRIISQTVKTLLFKRYNNNKTSLKYLLEIGYPFKIFPENNDEFKKEFDYLHFIRHPQNKNRNLFLILQITSCIWLTLFQFSQRWFALVFPYLISHQEYVKSIDRCMSII